jgi:hypothetical protein
LEVQFQEEDEALQAELEACNRRKQELQDVAEFNFTPEVTEMEKENNLRFDNSTRFYN